jgi:catalase-peroxidase
MQCVLMSHIVFVCIYMYYRFDGRGGANTGNIRLAPLNSWPDNANLDKARLHILWPIKQKYGQSISWGDLIILAGNVAIEMMMSQDEPLWFGGGRVDAFEAEEDVFWGHETEWLKDDQRGDGGNLQKPLGATQMGLIYVNPEGPGGNPDILASARDIRTTFSRMGMTDMETVALIAGGHTFGKAHGAADPDKYVEAEPEGAPVHEMGLGWKNGYKSGKGADTITSGLEGAWTNKPTEWDGGYFNNLYQYEWVQTKSPGGATQWVPSEESIRAAGGNDAVQNVPDAHDDNTKHLPIMFTTDLAMRYDPIYGAISEKFHADNNEFKEQFKRAWYKLCHRDMGPKSRHLGPWVPKEDLIWMDPVPQAIYDPVNSNDIQELKNKVLDLLNSSEVSISDLVKTAWASASTYRCTDHRGGANGGRIRLEPQRSWAVNDPSTLQKLIPKLEYLQIEFNLSSHKKVSFADLVVLAANVAIEEAARQAGFGDIKVPFVPGRTDASQSETDVNSFNALEPVLDGFRNYEESSAGSLSVLPEAALLDRAHLLSLSAPEMAVLIGGLRVLNANADNSNVGLLTERPGVLTNDFFINLLDMSTTWSPIEGGRLFKGTGPSKSWVASRTDLIFGSNSQLRAISESYASSDSQEHFIKDFVNAWTKVSMLDRFDVASEVVEPKIKL